MKQIENLIEFTVWHNGSPVSYPVAHFVDPAARHFQRFRMVAQDHPLNGYDVGFTPSGELVENWLSGTMELLAMDGSLIAGRRPSMIYLGPSDLPMVTIFEAIVARPIQWAGIWAVATRAQSRTYDFNVPPAEPRP